MKRSSISVLLAAAMSAGLLAGCAAPAAPAAEAPAQGAAPAAEAPAEGAAPAAEEAEAADTAEAAQPAESDEELTEISIALMMNNSYDASVTDPIVERLNEISESKANVHVNVNFYDAGSYMTQVPLELTAGSGLDLIFCTPMPATSFGTLYSQNQLMDITDLMEEYAPETLEVLGSYIGGTTIDGRVYGVPCYRTYTQTAYVIMRQDILDELGLAEKAAAMKTWSEYREIAKEVVEKKGIAAVGNSSKGSTLTLYPLAAGSDDFASNYWFDSLGDANSSIYIDENTDTVYNYFETEEYKNAAQRAFEWYHDGLVYKDAAISEDSGETLMKNGAFFSYIISGGFDAEPSKEASTGFELCLVPITNYKVSTKSTQFFSYAVPVNSQEPEAAVKFLNLMMTDPDVANTLCWGLEGRDWVEVDGEACYPEGVDASNVAYHENDMLMGNTFIALPWSGSGADLREIELEFESKGTASKYLGFTFDSSAITNEATAVNSVTLEYAGMLSAGTEDDFEKTYGDFLAKLKDAGIDTVVAEYQRQIDAWLAAK